MCCANFKVNALSYLFILFPEMPSKLDWLLVVFSSSCKLKCEFVAQRWFTLKTCIFEPLESILSLFILLMWLTDLDRSWNCAS